MTDEEILKVVRAAQSGRFDEIEQAFIHRDAPTPWIQMDGTSFNFDAFVYRLKPKPREWYHIAWKDGAVSVMDADRKPDQVPPGAIEVIHVREVIE